MGWGFHNWVVTAQGKVITIYVSSRHNENVSSAFFPFTPPHHNNQTNQPIPFWSNYLTPNALNKLQQYKARDVHSRKNKYPTDSGPPPTSHHTLSSLTNIAAHYNGC